LAAGCCPASAKRFQVLETWKVGAAGWAAFAGAAPVLPALWLAAGCCPASAKRFQVLETWKVGTAGWAALAGAAPVLPALWLAAGCCPASAKPAGLRHSRRALPGFGNLAPGRGPSP